MRETHPHPEALSSPRQVSLVRGGGEVWPSQANRSGL